MRHVPVAYEISEERGPRASGQWIIALALVGIVVAATLSLIMASETASTVAVEVSE